MPSVADLLSTLPYPEMAASLLAIALRGDDPGAAMVLATALGFTLAMAVFQIARALDAKSSVASGLGAVVFVLILVGGLGGLRPLLASLDSTRLGNGATAVLLLDIVNTVFIANLLLALARASIGFLSCWIGSAGAFDPSMLAQLIGQDDGIYQTTH